MAVPDASLPRNDHGQVADSPLLLHAGHVAVMMRVASDEVMASLGLSRRSNREDVGSKMMSVRPNRLSVELLRPLTDRDLALDGFSLNDIVE